MDQADFSSSDIEFEPTDAPFASAGAQSVKQMLEYAVEDRLTSKKRSEQLKFVRGSKKTQYMNHFWYVGVDAVYSARSLVLSSASLHTASLANLLQGTIDSLVSAPKV
jgi:hypothetical protein